MNLHGCYIKRVKTAKKWRRKNGCGVQLDPPQSQMGGFLSHTIYKEKNLKVPKYAYLD